MSILISRTGQMACYVARDVYKVPRLHNTCVMLTDVPFHNIITPVFTLRSVPGNITHCLPGTTVILIEGNFTEKVSGIKNCFTNAA